MLFLQVELLKVKCYCFFDAEECYREFRCHSFACVPFACPRYVAVYYELFARKIRKPDLRCVSR